MAVERGNLAMDRAAEAAQRARAAAANSEAEGQQGPSNAGESSEFLLDAQENEAAVGGGGSEQAAGFRGWCCAVC